MSEGGLTLAQIVQQLDGYDDELLIWARARTDLADLTPDTEAVVAAGLEDDGVRWAERRAVLRARGGAGQGGDPGLAAVT